MNDFSANIYKLSDVGISNISYDEIEHVKLTRDFLDEPQRFFDTLFEY